MQLKYITSILFLLFTLSTFAQSDAVIELHAIQINSVRNTHSVLKNFEIDSLKKSNLNDQSLGEYLDKLSPLAIKNYGPGALSSISMRGGSAYHTAVLWKGFSIANPMNGVMDFNLIPLYLFDDISIQFGGACSLWGSGAISGAIQLNENNKFQNYNSISVGSRFGNASGMTNYAKVNLGKGKLSTSISLFATDEKNAYPFFQNGIQKKQIHSEAKGQGLVAENTLLINSSTSINFNFWYQYSDRNIAPVLTEQVSDANQKDKNYRYNLTLLKTFRKSKIVFRNAYFNEGLYYNDSSLTSPSNSLCKSFIIEPEFSQTINSNNSFEIGVNYSNVRAIASEFKNKISTNKKAIYFAYHFLFKKINLSASLRKQFNDFVNPPLVYSLSGKYKISENLNFLASYSTVYRDPQINDLYWQPGGNPNLLPETGKSYEATLAIDLTKFLKPILTDSSKFLLEITAFNKDIDNWIAWTPHGFLWSPSNIKSVHSYGSEIALVYQKMIGLIKINFNAFYAYTISETMSSIIPFDGSVDKQLIYVPIHKAGSGISIYFHNTSLSIDHSYSGIRFTSTDNKNYLEPYHKTNLQINQRFLSKKNMWSAFLRIGNLFNTNYQAVTNRPEPLRNFSIGLNFTFKNH